MILVEMLINQVRHILDTGEYRRSRPYSERARRAADHRPDLFALRRRACADPQGRARRERSECGLRRLDRHVLGGDPARPPRSRFSKPPEASNRREECPLAGAHPPGVERQTEECRGPFRPGSTHHARPRQLTCRMAIVRPAFRRTECFVFFTRFTILGLSLVTALVSGYYLPRVWAIPLFAISALLSLIGLYDLAQPLHSVRRNYPIVGRLRWLFEDIRPGDPAISDRGRPDEDALLAKPALAGLRARQERAAAIARSARSWTSTRMAMSSSPIPPGRRPSPIRRPSGRASAATIAASPMRPRSSTSRR